METKKKIALNKLQELKLYMKIMTCRWCCVCFGCSLPVFYLLLHLMCLNIPEESSLMSRSDQDVYYYLCIYYMIEIINCLWVGFCLVYLCAAHWRSSRAGRAFAVLGAGAGFGHGWAVCLLPLDDTAWWGWHEDNKPMKKGKKRERQKEKKKVWQWYELIK